MAELTLNQMANLMYEGQVIEVVFKSEKLGTLFGERYFPKVPAERSKNEQFYDIGFDNFYSEQKTHSYLAPQLEVKVGDLVWVPVIDTLELVEVVGIVDETSLDLDYSEKYKFAIAVLDKTDLITWKDQTKQQNRKLQNLQKEKAKHLRAQLKKAFFEALPTTADKELDLEDESN